MVMINIRLIFVATFVTEYLETDAEYSMLEWTYAKKYAFVGTNFTNEISARKAITAIFCASFCSKIMTCTGFLFSDDFRTCRFLNKILTAADNSELTKQRWIYFERNKYDVDCPDDWKENQVSMYCFVHQKVNWTSAQQKCSTMGAYLVAIESEQEDAWIDQQILLYRKKGNIGDWWTGATDEKSEGTFYWHHSRELLVFDQWNPGEPSGGSIENCVLKVYSGNWQDFPCSFEYYYICER